MRTLIRPGDGSHLERPRMAHVTEPAEADTSQTSVAGSVCLSGCTRGRTPWSPGCARHSARRFHLIFTTPQRGEDYVGASSTKVEAMGSGAWLPGFSSVTHWLSTLASNPYLCAHKVGTILFPIPQDCYDTYVNVCKALRTPSQCSPMIPTITLHAEQLRTCLL